MDKTKEVVSKRNMMAQARGEKTNFAYGETYKVSEKEAEVYLHRKWCVTPEQAKEQKIFPVKNDEGKKK